jgi:hypothetical protein
MVARLHPEENPRQSWAQRGYVSKHKKKTTDNAEAQRLEENTTALNLMKIPRSLFSKNNKWHHHSVVSVLFFQNQSFPTYMIHKIKHLTRPLKGRQAYVFGTVGKGEMTLLSHPPYSHCWLK